MNKTLEEIKYKFTAEDTSWFSAAENSAELCDYVALLEHKSNAIETAKVQALQGLTKAVELLHTAVKELRTEHLSLQARVKELEKLTYLGNDK